MLPSVEENVRPDQLNLPLLHLKKQKYNDNVQKRESIKKNRSLKKKKSNNSPFNAVLLLLAKYLCVYYLLQSFTVSL